MKTNNKGFSLVELIVVIAIMAILAAVAIPTFAGFIDKANQGKDESYLNDLAYAVELARAEDGGLGTDHIVVEIAQTNGEYKVSKVYLASDNTKADIMGEINDVVDPDFTFSSKMFKAADTFISDGEGGWILEP